MIKTNEMELINALSKKNNNQLYRRKTCK